MQKFSEFLPADQVLPKNNQFLHLLPVARKISAAAIGILFHDSEIRQSSS